MRSCLIVDDVAETRSALVAAVRAAQKGVQEFHEAMDEASALKLFHEHAPDVVFLDMSVPDGKALADEGIPGLSILKAILAARPFTPVVVTGVSGSRPEIVDAVSLGAIAALRRPLKNEDVKFVLDAIEPEAARMDYFG